MKTINIDLCEELNEDFLSWYECCISLGVKPNINRFLVYTYNYGTYKNPKEIAR